MSLNKTTLIGHLGADPELKDANGKNVVNVNLATTESYMKGDEKVQHTEWHRLVIWDKLAEITNKYLKKGSHVYVEGKLRTRSWEDQDGKKMYTTEIFVTDIQFLDKKES